MKRKHADLQKMLIIYYGLLQTLHLLALARAGLLIAGGNPPPFPILPPSGGWTEEAMAFMYGLAGTDVIGIIIGIIFAYKAVINKDYNPWLGLLSLTIFITGAIVFGAGTFPSGAWGTHPVAYWVMVVLFLPSLGLYYLLLKNKTDQ